MKTELENLKKEINERIDRLLKPDYEVGKWYWLDDGNSFPALVVYNGDKETYGFCFRGNWTTEFGEEGTWTDRPGRKYRPATPSEIEEALKKEAIKRGFKEGVTVSRSNELMAPILCYKESVHITSDTFRYDEKWDVLCLGGLCIYCKGRWAEIVEQPITIGGYEVEFPLKDHAGILGCHHPRKYWEAAKIVAGAPGTLVHMAGRIVPVETINKILARL